jgi:4-diphosphocytidyl-2-C-methyl-D-erythritol kinase
LLVPLHRRWRGQRAADMPISVFAPAKINLFLAVTGRRADGFHDLVSVVAPLDFGDTLRVEAAETFTLECDDAAVPVGADNLVLKAASAFAQATAGQGGLSGAKFFLEKRIPMGAGLGGGSSDAVAALRVLNELAGGPLAEAALAELAATLGSDCPLFLAGGPVVMRGRGECVEPLSEGVAQRLCGRQVLVFKPGFGVPTPWAYARMVAQPDTYMAAADAEARLAAWIADERRPVEELLFNNMEHEVFKKFVALSALFGRLRADFALAPRMSGSGSACFAFLRDDAPVEAIERTIREAWGDSAFLMRAKLR